MTGLPVLAAAGDLLVIDPDTGEALPIGQASDRALAHAAEKVTELDRDLYAAKRALAAELRSRHGIGTIHTGGYEFKVTEAMSWPAGATAAALTELVTRGVITDTEAARAMPDKPKPNTAVLKSLAARLAVTDPDAHRVLVAACTVSPPSVRDLHPDAVTVTAEQA